MQIIDSAFTTNSVTNSDSPPTLLPCPLPRPRMTCIECRQQSDIGKFDNPMNAVQFLRDLMSPPPLSLLTPTPLAYLIGPDKVTVATQTTEYSPPETNRRCTVCSQIFTSPKGMKLHIARVHTNIKRQEPCPICLKLFKHKYAVKFHVKQVHEQATRVTCPSCDKQFYNKYKLNKHVKNRHLKTV